MISRRAFLAGLGATLVTSRALAAPARAKRVLFFYFPDGVPNPEGQASRWHASGSETSFSLPDTLSPLEPFKGDCIFTTGLSMGPTDSGSHPGGAKKLLTAVDGGNGESIDRRLARTIGGGAPFGHVYLGAMATHNGASGDKFISYPAAGTTVPPEDDPAKAFQRLFSTTPPSEGPGDTSVLDAAMADLAELRQRAGEAEKQKLELHLDALRDLERRVKGGGGTCEKPGFVAPPGSNDHAMFPAILKAQIDIMVQAMACNLTRVGVIQASQHTSELIMSRFAGTDMYRPSFDMRSHQASHYGQTSDPKYADFVLQRRWLVSRFAYLLSELKKRAEPGGDGGTMLDNSIVALVTEVSDGNMHLHDNMPFILAGRGGGLRTGRLLQYSYRRHGDLWAAVANAAGDNLSSFGQDSQGPLSLT
jgi:hypothetical protein